ncbi:MAG: aspartyl protease family protein [Bacteroidales bacterium]
MKTLTQKLLLTLLSFLLLGSAYAQLTGGCGNAPENGSFRWTPGVVSTSFPFELIGNIVVIPVEISNVKLRFILDTGMPSMGGLITNYKKGQTLNLTYMGEAKVGGAGGGFSSAKVAGGVIFRIGDIEFFNQTVVVMPESKNLSYFESDGVIGNEILTQFIVDINYDSKIITLSDPVKFKPPTDYQAIDIPFEGYYPYVKCSATFENGVTVPLTMVLDLGASHSLSLNIGTQKGIELPKKNLTISAGRGLNSEITGKTGRIKSFTFGSYSFESPLVSFNEKKLMPFEKEGNLGSGILNRFNIIFDYPNKKMYIKPNKTFKNPFEFNMAGIQYSKMRDGRVVIDRVLPETPASEAGLVAMDEIVKIDGADVNSLDKTGLRKIFEIKGKVVVLTIKRKDEIKTISVKLRKII